MFFRWGQFTIIGVLVAACRAVGEQRADAVVSAGNTGAMMASAVLMLGRIAKIDRPALSQAIPTQSGRMLCLLGTFAGCWPRGKSRLICTDAPLTRSAPGSFFMKYKLVG